MVQIKKYFSCLVLLCSSTAFTAEDLYLNKIQPIFASKCIACHGCNASPCEMKMDSFAAVDRGANKEKQPFGKHLPNLTPLRMKDAKSTAEWRAKLFFPVLARTEDPARNLSESVLFKFIQSGMSNNDPKNIDLQSLQPLMDHEATNFGKRSCPDINEVDAFLAKPEHKHAGMPLALPSLTPQEYLTLSEWMMQGAPGPSKAALKELHTLSESQNEVIQKWESFFNIDPSKDPQEQIKNKLTSRYLYEHVVLTHIEFEEIPGKFYELVRAKDKSGDIDELVTETAMDKVPGNGEFYYRFKPLDEVIVQKSHVVWKLSNRKMQRLKELFYETPWKEKLIDIPYESDNPFYNFAQIPAKSRYRFMLDEAKIILNAMIRGPVCVGPSATYAIRDQFWIFFAHPDSDITVADPTLGTLPPQQIPSSPEQVAFMMAKNFSEGSSSLYREKFHQTYKKLMFEKGNPFKQGWSIKDVWDGKDPNFINKDQAVETIFRHGTSASVEAGARGRIPPTLWFMTYAGFERLYYNLVTQFKYWDNVHHRLETWQAMRRHREEYEEGFISLLPENVRSSTRKSWTTSISGRAVRHLLITGAILKHVDEKREAESIQAIEKLMVQLRRHVISSSILSDWDPINFIATGLDPLPEKIETFEDWELALRNLTARKNQNFSQFLPEATYVKLRVGSEEKLYSLLTYRGYDTHNYSVDQKYARNPAEDHLTAFPGIIGDFPNLMVELDSENAVRFLKDLSTLSSENSFKEFQNKHAVLRNNEDFWKIFAELQSLNFKNLGSEAGLLDLNYYGGF